MKTAVLKGQTINLKVRQFKNPALRWEIEKQGSFSALDYYYLIYDDPDTGKREVLGRDYSITTSQAKDSVHLIEKRKKVRIQEIEKLHTNKLQAAALAKNASGWWAVRRDSWGSLGGQVLSFVRLWLLICIPVHLLIGAVAWLAGADGFDPAVLWMMGIADMLLYVGVTVLQSWLVVDPERGIDWAKIKL